MAILVLKLNKMDASEIGLQLGMSPNAVYAARYRFRHGYQTRPKKRGPMSVTYEYVS